MKINLTKIYFVVIIIMYIIINYINIDNVIAKRNIDRYFEDTSGNYELDMDYLQSLGIDAVGQIKRLENIEDENIKEQVKFYLNNTKSDVEDITWQSFNINRCIVKNELKEYEK